MFLLTADYATSLLFIQGVPIKGGIEICNSMPVHLRFLATLRDVFVLKIKLWSMTTGHVVYVHLSKICHTVCLDMTSLSHP